MNAISDNARDREEYWKATDNVLNDQIFNNSKERVLSFFLNVEIIKITLRWNFPLLGAHIHFWNERVFCHIYKVELTYFFKCRFLDSESNTLWNASSWCSCWSFLVFCLLIALQSCKRPYVHIFLNTLTPPQTVHFSKKHFCVHLALKRYYKKWKRLHPPEPFCSAFNFLKSFVRLLVVFKRKGVVPLLLTKKCWFGRSKTWDQQIIVMFCMNFVFAQCFCI